MKRNTVLNILFIALFIIFLIISLLVDFFFFIPIVCFLPFSFNTLRNKENDIEERSPQALRHSKATQIEIKYCQKCGGEIREPKAQFCYHCGEKLNNK
jgi:hypothetical protein